MLCFSTHLSVSKRWHELLLSILPFCLIWLKTDVNTVSKKRKDGKIHQMPWFCKSPQKINQKIRNLAPASIRERQEDTAVIKQNENALTVQNNNSFTLCACFFQGSTEYPNLYLWNPALNGSFSQFAYAVAVLRKRLCLCLIFMSKSKDR